MPNISNDACSPSNGSPGIAEVSPVTDKRENPQPGQLADARLNIPALNVHCTFFCDRIKESFLEMSMMFMPTSSAIITKKDALTPPNIVKLFQNMIVEIFSFKNTEKSWELILE